MIAIENNAIWQSIGYFNIPSFLHLQAHLYFFPFYLILVSKFLHSEEKDNIKPEVRPSPTVDIPRIFIKIPILLLLLYHFACFIITHGHSVNKKPFLCKNFFVSEFDTRHINSTGLLQAYFLDEGRSLTA